MRRLDATAMFSRLKSGRPARHRVPIAGRDQSCNTRLLLWSPTADCGRSCRRLGRCRPGTWNRGWIRARGDAATTSIDTSYRWPSNATHRGTCELPCPCSSCTLKRHQTIPLITIISQSVSQSVNQSINESITLLTEMKHTVWPR